MPLQLPSHDLQALICLPSVLSDASAYSPTFWTARFQTDARVKGVLS